MKTAISIPDTLFNEAESLAKRLGLSRSALYAAAVEGYLEEHSREGITEKLNEVYSDIDGRIDSQIVEMELTAVELETAS